MVQAERELRAGRFESALHPGEDHHDLADHETASSWTASAFVARVLLAAAGTDAEDAREPAEVALSGARCADLVHGAASRLGQEARRGPFPRAGRTALAGPSVAPELPRRKRESQARR